MGSRRQREVVPEKDQHMIKKYLDKVSVKYLPLMTRVLNSTGTQGDAIKAKCYDCVGFEDIPLNVHGCRAYTCPIWPFRPVSSVEQE